MIRVKWLEIDLSLMGVLIIKRTIIVVFNSLREIYFDTVTPSISFNQ